MCHPALEKIRIQQPPKVSFACISLTSQWVARRRTGQLGERWVLDIFHFPEGVFALRSIVPNRREGDTCQTFGKYHLGHADSVVL